MFEGEGAFAPAAPEDGATDETKKAEALKRVDNLIRSGAAASVVRHLAEFEEAGHKEIALRLIDAKKSHVVADGLKHFQGLDQEVALRLIAEGKGEPVAGAIDSFTGVDFIAIADRLIGAGRGGALARNLNKFPGVDHKLIADKLIAAGRGDELASSLNKFQGLDLAVLVDDLFESGQEEAVGKNIRRFEGIDHTSIAERLIAVGKSRVVAENLKHFCQLDAALASQLVDQGEGFYVVKEMGSFKGLDYGEFARELIDKGAGEYLIGRYDEFPGLDGNDIVARLLDAGEASNLVMYLAKFKDLSADTALRLVRLGHAGSVIAHATSFKIDSLSFYATIGKEYPGFLERVEKEMPIIAAQAKKSLAVMLNMLSEEIKLERMKDDLDRYPFLSDVVEANPRYGSKLFLKFHDFDENAKQNIQLLYESKKRILTEEPGMDTQSAEFRKLMQGQLAGYKNNAAIAAELEARTGNRQWLDYEGGVEFTLGGEQADFSEQMRLPIDRMVDLAEKYKKTVFGVLAPFEEELKKAGVPRAEAAELEAYIAKMEERLVRAKNDSDDAQAAGIEKGIAGAKSKLGKMKSVSVWEKWRGEMRRMSLLASDTAGARESCSETEEKIQRLMEGGEKKQLIAAKDELSRSKRMLRDKLLSYESCINPFADNLHRNLADVLGSGRAEAMTQEIRMQMEEQLSHYDSDRDSLAAVFGGDSGNEPFEGTDMCVRMASRDPDVDLYLGDYCPCCICIESDYHGKTSPIADYVTDLGMQNVVVFDEKRGIPVVACWCYLGEEAADDGGRLKLVIDNIEADTKYSGAYPEQIAAAIKSYIEAYAMACHIEKQDIIQGPDNNDLEIFELGRVARKLGGTYNRPEGYYLESLEETYD